jgi:hypothetical protein
MAFVHKRQEVKKGMASGIDDNRGGWRWSQAHVEFWRHGYHG